MDRMDDLDRWFAECGFGDPDPNDLPPDINNSPNPEDGEDDEDMVGKKSGKALLREEGKQSLPVPLSCANSRTLQVFNELTMA